MEDPDEIDPKAGGGDPMTIGQMVSSSIVIVAMSSSRMMLASTFIFYLSLILISLNHLAADFKLL